MEEMTARQIEVILNNKNAVAAIEIFRQNMEDLDEEITALSTIRDILNRFVEELSKTTELPFEDIMPQDDMEVPKHLEKKQLSGGLYAGLWRSI